jgi:hypothetical protein
MINAIRKLQVNPELGEFHIHAALERLGIHPRNTRRSGEQQPPRSSSRRFPEVAIPIG